MGTCKFCRKQDKLFSETLRICRKCILNGNWEEIKKHILAVHADVRKTEDLPPHPPSHSSSEIKFQCNLCINECKLSREDKSFCGLRSIKKDKENSLPMPTKSKAYMHGYLDRNPTNCCNAWFCPAGTDQGYPQYSNYKTPESRTYSYAAFLYGCSFDCLFCQNSSHKNISKMNIVNANNLAENIASNTDITCICYFGGTPEPQLPFTINLSNLILQKIKTQEKRKFRICWEWNGSGKRELAEKCMKLAIKSGGNIKFDLKSFHERLNYALCGISNKRTLSNFEFLAKKYFGTREEQIPEMSGCTLLVPGYTTKEEVELIAQFISSINENIPYSLLVFHGAYQMRDLGITPKKQALECERIAKKYLNNVHLGNTFLLSS
jgi:pyruvate formate lyase activating enzyme